MFEKKLIIGPTAWLIASLQLIEVISYLHDDCKFTEFSMSMVETLQKMLSTVRGVTPY